MRQSVLSTEVSDDEVTRNLYASLSGPQLPSHAWRKSTATAKDTVEYEHHLVRIYDANKRQLVQVTQKQFGAHLASAGKVMLFAARLGHPKEELVAKRDRLKQMINSVNQAVDPNK